jgi:hypothetical protein
MFARKQITLMESLLTQSRTRILELEGQLEKEREAHRAREKELVSELLTKLLPGRKPAEKRLPEPAGNPRSRFPSGAFYEPFRGEGSLEKMDQIEELTAAGVLGGTQR